MARPKAPVVAILLIAVAYLLALAALAAARHLSIEVVLPLSAAGAGLAERAIKAVR